MAWLVILFLLYWVPTIIAVFRGHQVSGVILLNLFLGWTIIGWCLAIVLALGKEKPSQVVIVQAQPPPAPPLPAAPVHAETPPPLPEGKSGGKEGGGFWAGVDRAAEKFAR